MKKLIIAAVLTVLSISSSFAGALPIGFGLRVTGNANWFKISDLPTGLNVDKRNIGTGFAFGPYIRIGVKKIYADIELSYSMKKYDTDLSGPGIKANVVTNASSLDLPVTLGWKFIKAGPVDLRVLAGAGVSSVLSKNTQVEGKDNDMFNDDTQSVYGYWIAGVGADVWKLNVDLKYYGGLSTLIDGDTGKYSPNSVNLSLGLRLFGGK